MYKWKASSNIKYEVIEFNIGIEESQKMVKFGKGTNPNEREKSIILIREFKDIFSWTHEYLKAYHEYVIQHIIPLKEAQNPSGRYSDK